MKNFDDWNNLKKDINNKTNRPHIKTGGVYWCKVGVNVGTEYDGKGESFSRPIIIIKKYSNKTAFIIPLTTQKHDSDWYFNLNIKNKEVWAILNQGKTIDVVRLEKLIITLPKNKILNIVDSFYKLLLT